ncbi:hypothetical protein CR513_02799, partial [Mucuna pruriens]
QGSFTCTHKPIYRRLISDSVDRTTDKTEVDRLLSRLQRITEPGFQLKRTQFFFGQESKSPMDPGLLVTKAGSRIRVNKKVEKLMVSKDLYHVVKPRMDGVFVFGVIAFPDYIDDEAEAPYC